MESAVDTVLAGFNEVLELPVERIGEVGIDVAIPQFQSSVVTDICNEAIDVLKKQPSLLRLSGEVHVIGDIHGSLHDLLRLFRVFGMSQGKYLFLGDYVDRGSFSTETILLLLALFVKYPDRIYLIRGNHECAEISSSYGFYGELKQLYSDDVFFKFIELFAYLPLAAVVNDNYFCVHGGIVPSLRRLEQVQQVQRPLNDFCSNKMVHEMVWSDPTDNFQGFVESERGAGVVYGQFAVDEFLEANKLKGIIRGHEYEENGIAMRLNNKVFTVFSASSYKTQQGNKVGVLTLSDVNKTVAMIWPPMKKIQRDFALFYTYYEHRTYCKTVIPLSMMKCTIKSSPSIPSSLFTKKMLPKYKSNSKIVTLNRRQSKIVCPEVKSLF